MARTTHPNEESRRLTSRHQIAHDQTRQGRHRHRAPPKRSVSSLSATQLERKRANDREAQRLIRQRTKDRIEGLEKQLSDLRNENQRLNRCLKQKSSRDTDGLRKGFGFDAGSTSWSCCKVVNPSRCRDTAPQGEPSAYGLFTRCLTARHRY